MKEVILKLLKKDMPGFVEKYLYKSQDKVKSHCCICL